MPHFDKDVANDADMLKLLLQMFHGQGISERIQSGWSFLRAQMRKRGY